MTEFVATRSIDEVLDRLDAEIEAAVRAGNRNAYFTCLYRAVTQRVLDGIRAGRFEDPARMQRLDVVFANRYLAAYHAYQGRQRASESWMAAFEASRMARLVILQHLLLGMNAHINLDLGIAAAQVSPGADLPALRRDFHEISVLLGEMLDDVQSRLARVSPWLGVLDVVGARKDEHIFSFGLTGARDLAWKSAERFAGLPKHEWDAETKRLDRTVLLLSLPIRRPTPLIATALMVVRAREPNDVSAVTKVLR